MIKHAKYEITSDGVTVWVNSDEGYCLARFGRMGIDVHLQPRYAGENECAYCTHAKTTKMDWYTFKKETSRVHGIDIPEAYLPDRFQGLLAPDGKPHCFTK